MMEVSDGGPDGGGGGGKGAGVAAPSLVAGVRARGNWATVNGAAAGGVTV